MARSKMKMEVGKRYKGCGWINEYGQTFFEAYQSNQRDNAMKLVKENESYSLYESGNFLKIAVKIEKETDKFEMIKKFMAAFQDACFEIKNYNMG